MSARGVEEGENEGYPGMQNTRMMPGAWPNASSNKMEMEKP